MLVKKEWFRDWFDSPYYHLLYRNRDEREAHLFIDHLCQYLNLMPEHDRIIDLACGKGRHSIYLNSLGYQVTGVDLSPQSIREASKFINNRLRFEVQDLRQLSMGERYQIGLNLFTSFGYFQSMEENVQVLLNIRNALVSKGRLVIDFMNSPRVLHELVDHESRSCNGIRFTISKWVESGFICKRISVDDDDMTIEFMEKVQALSLEQFTQLLNQSGFRILHIFGDYALNAYDHNLSERLILIAERID